MSEIKRNTYVIYNPKTDKWEVWELTPAEAFDLDQDRFGVDVAIHNMNYSEDKDKQCAT